MVQKDRLASIVNLVETSALTGKALRQFAMDKLSALPTYDWSGVYRLGLDQLELDAFCGAPTEHTRIPVGIGVCGTAVAENKNQIVADVRELGNYLSCSAATRSEIVVLIRNREGQVLGQIDIDGHQVGAFQSEDEEMLDSLAKIFADRWV